MSSGNGKCSKYLIPFGGFNLKHLIEIQHVAKFLGSNNFLVIFCEVLLGTFQNYVFVSLLHSRKSNKK